ncbi:MAG TPA: hypothetical protein VF323_12245 [Candidatus Limnocylindrales bacterium]
MHRKSSAARIAALIGGLVLLGSSVLVRPAAMAAASPTRPFAGSFAHSQVTRGTATSRGRVLARDLARTAKPRPGIHSLPAIHPVLKASRPGATGPKVAAPILPVQSTATAGAAPRVTGFAGVTATTPGEAALEPPDPYLAVGPDSVVQVVNLLARITDRNGAAVTDLPLPDFFFVPAGGADTDPRVVYDPIHSRWVMTEASWDCTPGGGALFGHGALDVAISDTADPTGFWSVFFLPFIDQFPDFPGLGTSSDKAAISANIFEMKPRSAPGALDCIDTTLDGADLVAFDWSDMADGGNLTYSSVEPITNPALDHAFTLRPAIQAPATSPTIYWVGYVDNLAGGWNEAWGAVTGSVLAGTISFKTPSLLDTVVSPPIQPVPQPHQPTTPLTITEAVDERITDAVWQANKMTYVATYPCTPTGDSATRDCVRVTQLTTPPIAVSPNPQTAPTLLQDFLVAQTGKDLYMGGIGVSGNGALHAVWTRSSATAGDFPSTFSAYQLPSDPANALSAPLELAHGTATYPGTHWGDYVGVPQDPQDPNAVWQADEYSTTPTGGNWNTKVNQMVTGSGSTYVPIAPVRVLNTIAGVGLTGKFLSGAARTFQVAGAFGIPPNAKAITGNLAVTRQNGAGFASITVNPTNTPATSTINFPLGDVRANNLTTPLSATGTLSAIYKSTAGKTTDLVLDVTGYFLDDNSGATFTPITPVRLLNTSDPLSPTGKFQAGVPQTLQVTGVSGIPANATAISGNLAVLGQSAAGFVSVTPDPTSVPSTSTINFPLNDVRANGLTVQLSTTGLLTGSLSAVYIATPGATTDLVLDVNGYYVHDLLGLHFFPLNPGRRINTSIGSPIPIFHSVVPQTVAIDGHEGVPVGASAITGNLAVFQQTGAGFVSITPDPTTTPATSTINFPLGDVRANGVTVPTNGSGSMSFVYRAGTGKTTQLVLDVTGYFK